MTTRWISGLGAALAMALLAGAADATTVSGSIGNGALSSSISMAASTVMSISFPGPAPLDSSHTGLNQSLTCFTIMRSQDNTAGSFAPLLLASGALAHYCGPATIDVTESRSGTYYAIQADPGAPVFAYRLDQ